MKTYAFLTIPKNYKSLTFSEPISAPLSQDGVKMAAWWADASPAERMAILSEGQETGDYVAAWKKLAASEIVDTDPENAERRELDLKSIVKQMEQSNEDRGDPSPMTQPPSGNT